jgi:hypothetical protein
LNDEHDSVWYESEITPLVKDISHKLMAHIHGERLGGILITKLPPYGLIYPHSDSGWHANFYDKYYICIKDSGSRFVFENGEIHPQEGEVYWFDNSYTHSVINGPKERLSMIICAKGEKPCLGQ